MNPDGGISFDLDHVKDSGVHTEIKFYSPISSIEKKESSANSGGIYVKKS